MIKPIIELDGTITSVWKGTSKQGKPINLAEFINSEDGKRYVLTSPGVLVEGHFWFAVTQNHSEMSYSVYPITKEEYEDHKRKVKKLREERTKMLSKG